MSPARRAAAPRLIDWTGERCVPWAPDVAVVYEHLHRYLWAAQFVEGRRVLDLGSGEGFGAALLAESATSVVGVDVDAVTVEHSRLNYEGTNLEFQLGDAIELGAFADGSLDVVVAFEIIEHVAEQERVLTEVARVLADDGLLIISTPDRRMYEKSRTEPNPFHVRELSLEEFLQLVGDKFPHVASWGQRTITGSHLDALQTTPSGEAKGSSQDFFIERAGDEWRVAGEPAPLYCIALASRAELPSASGNSTLVDAGLELMRVKERQAAEIWRQATEESAALSRELEGARAEVALAHRDRDVRTRKAHEERDEGVRGAERETARGLEALQRSEHAAAELRERLASAELQLADTRMAQRRVEESVTWQAFQKMRSRLYRAIGGERSLLARALGASLRVAGRGMTRHRRAEDKPPEPMLSEPLEPPELIEFPEYAQPQVSLIIPVHAHADLTRACLLSIRDRTAGVHYEVILVDDTSDAQTLELLECVRGAKIIRNDTNLGFLRSMNRGAGLARGEWLVLFNNDTEVTRGWLSAMVECAHAASDAGVVTPKFIYPDGTLNEAGGIVWRDGTAMNYGRGDAADRFQYEYRRETDYGSAAALMVNARLWRDVGGFDERFRPIYYEDTDICFQAREHGLRVLYEPKAVVVHIEGATSGSDPSSGAKRHQEQNRHKFVEKWRSTLQSEHHYPASSNVRQAANRARGQHVLVIDHRVPMWDRDSGSLRMLSIMRALIALGARVTFMPDNLMPVAPYTRRLQEMGIEVLYGALDVRAELATIGPRLTTAILCRPHVASRWLDTVREFAPSATVVYDTVDLHWLREARRGASSATASELVEKNGSLDPKAIQPKARALREIELALIRASDATLVLNEAESVQVKEDVPGARVLVLPNVHDVEAFVPPAESRSGVLFVGGFEHPPNVDAVVRLVKDVMPAVWSQLGAVHVTIAGGDPPPEVLALASPLVDVVGWVEDLHPLLEQSRVMVAPLRYGAGLKGKVTQCLAVGLPVVTTSIGAEGLVPADESVSQSTERCILVADQAHQMAKDIVRVYTDDELWQQLSRGGQKLIGELCSIDLVVGRLNDVLVGKALGLDEDEAQPTQARA